MSVKRDLPPLAQVGVSLLNNDENTRKLQDDIKDLSETCDINTGYLYYAIKSVYNEKEVRKTFAENQDDFGNYLHIYLDFTDEIVFKLYETKDELFEKNF